MGQNNFKSSDNRATLPLNWYQSPTHSDILINRLTQQHLQKHLITIPIKDLPKQTTLMCARIANNHPHVVHLYHYHSITNQPEPVTHQQTHSRYLQVYTDHLLPLRPEDWTPQKIIHIIQALKRLVFLYGPFLLQEQMISLNQSAEVKVWINHHPPLNHPTYVCDSQEQTLNSLVNILLHKNPDLTRKLRGSHTLRDALERLQHQQNTVPFPYQRLSYRNADHQTLPNTKIGFFQTPPLNPSNQLLQINRVSSLKTYQKQFLTVVDNHDHKHIKSHSNFNNFPSLKSQFNKFATSKTIKAQQSHDWRYHLGVDHRDSLNFSQISGLTLEKAKETPAGQQQKIKNKGFKINPFIFPDGKESSQLSYHQQQPSLNAHTYATPLTNTPSRLSHKQVCNNLNPSVIASHSHSTSAKELQLQPHANIHLQKSHKIQHCTSAKNKYLNLTETNNHIKTQTNKVPIFIKNMKKKTCLEDQKPLAVHQNKSININFINDHEFTNLQIKPKQEDAREDMNKSTKQSFISGQPYRSRPDSHPKKHTETHYYTNPLNEIKQLESLSKHIKKSKSPFRQKSGHSHTNSRLNINQNKHILTHIPSISYFNPTHKSQFKKQKQKTLNRTKTSQWSNKTPGHLDTITFRTQLEANTHRKNTPQTNKPIPQPVLHRQPQQIKQPHKQTHSSQKHSLKKQLQLQFQSLLDSSQKALPTHLNNRQPQSPNQEPDQLKSKIKMKQLAFAELKKQALMVLTDD